LHCAQVKLLKHNTPVPMPTQFYNTIDAATEAEKAAKRQRDITEEPSNLTVAHFEKKFAGWYTITGFCPYYCK
jgi:hypothetical protein